MAKMQMNCDKLVSTGPSSGKLVSTGGGGAGKLVSTGGGAGKMSVPGSSGGKETGVEFSQHCKIFDHHMKVCKLNYIVDYRCFIKDLRKGGSSASNQYHLHT